MSEPYRHPAVTIGLDLYRKGLSALGDALAQGGTAAWHAARGARRWGSSELRRLIRPSGETMPAMIGQRLRGARSR